ncbi:MAG: hypothetical protein ACREAY_04400 [Nitrososphaera sp.]|uniref:hypothetical protein n=1 Tax=Nitrososphaera sp. TaxID=1971748 RepID=UPI003D6ED2EC
MFGKGGIKPGEFIFVVQKDGEYNRIIIGRIQAVSGSKIRVTGTQIRPSGLIERVKAGKAGDRSRQVLASPDPNNCVFMLIDRVETSPFNADVDQAQDRVIWINENRYLVLDGWIKENLPEIFAAALTSAAEEDRQQAKAALREKMGSLYERDLKEHVYAVARSAKLL